MSKEELLEIINHPAFRAMVKSVVEEVAMVHTAQRQVHKVKERRAAFGHVLYKEAAEVLGVAPVSIRGLVSMRKLQGGNGEVLISSLESYKKRQQQYGAR